MKTENNLVKVWDPLVRIGHWSLVVLFFTAYLTGEDESDLHIYAGYVVMAIILVRIVWGFVGSRHARFSGFVKSPSETLSYLGDFVRGKPQHYLGHNPLGGWMVIALLVSILLVSWSGLEVYGAEGHGPLAKTEISLVSQVYADGDGFESEEEEFWEEIHELFANFTLFLVALHVGGVIASSLVHRENLVRAMITGYKKRDAG